MRREKTLFSSVAAFVMVMALGSSARGEYYYIANGYHAQQTPFYCGEGAMQMMLDSPAVQALNPGLPSQNLLYADSRFFNAVPMLGTDPVAVAATMNLADGVFHNYAWYGFTPTAFGANQASRTLADSLIDYGVPGSVVINLGGHWIDVNGVTTIGPVAWDKPYKITGFFIRDPWPLRGSLGANTWLAYNNRAWYSVFNPNPLFPPSPYAGQYAMVLEPTGPQALDNGSNDSTPPPPPNLPSELTASQAIAQAGSDLASDSALNTQFGLTNGGFDANAADALLLQLPGDSSTQGDWLIPYDGAGGSNDVTGALVINADTGTIDQATWIDNSQTPMALSQVQQMLQDQYSGNLVRDDIDATVVPEPSSALLLGLGGPVLFRFVHQRRRQTARYNQPQMPTRSRLMRINA